MFRNNILYYLGIFFFIVCLSCKNFFSAPFIINECTYIYQDGSGQYTLQLDLTKIKNFVHIANKLSHENKNQSIIKIIQETFKKIKLKIKNVPDIYIEENKYTTPTLLFSLTYCFKTIQALNQAMGIIYGYTNTKNNVLVTYDNQNFIRTTNYSLSNIIQNYKSDTALIKSFDIPFFFRNSIQHIKYIFDKKIKSNDNKLSIIDNKKQSFIIKYNVFQKNNHNITNEKITFYD